MFKVNDKVVVISEKEKNNINIKDCVGIVEHEKDNGDLVIKFHLGSGSFMLKTFKAEDLKKHNA